MGLGREQPSRGRQAIGSVRGRPAMLPRSQHGESRTEQYRQRWPSLELACLASTNLPSPSAPGRLCDHCTRGVPPGNPALLEMALPHQPKQLRRSCVLPRRLRLHFRGDT